MELLPWEIDETCKQREPGVVLIGIRDQSLFGRHDIMERLGGKVEAAIAAAILVVVIVIFAKYYEPGSAADSTANGRAPASSTRPVQ
jgi:hypothetical protein